MDITKGPTYFVLLFFSFLIFPKFGCSYNNDHVKDEGREERKPTTVSIGIVGDIDSPFGRMISMCMDMAVSDFYSSHPQHRAKLHLQKEHVESVLDLNLAVLDLAKHKDVIGIVGASDDTLLALVGEKNHVPIISFTTRSSNPYYAKNDYFVRTTVDDQVQAQALAAICRGFKWLDVVILYEDAKYGHHFLSHAIEAFQQVDIGLAQMISIPVASVDGHILQELYRLKMKTTKVFVVHMNSALCYRLLELASKTGMMTEGYAWIVTDSLSIFSNHVAFDARGSIDGVLAIRPYVHTSKNLQNFLQRWIRNATSKNVTSLIDLNIYGLWAYDAVTALARAAEKSMLQSTNNEKRDTNSRDPSFGPIFLSKISSTKFRGLAGDFELVKGVLKPSAFEIINIIGTGERRAGFWTPKNGITRELNTLGEPSYSTSTKELRKIMWPGDLVTPPIGWIIPPIGKLRVGIPWKLGFKEFVNAIVDPINNHTNATGFSIDIFLEALKVLPFPVDYDFYCYNDSRSSSWSYDDMLDMIPKKYDMVVGDTTIWAPRTSYVDFTLPYSESGVVLVVKNKKQMDMWIFIKPLKWDLWLAIIVACICMGIVLRMLERKRDDIDEESPRPHLKQHGLIYWSPIAILAFPERNMVSNNWSVFILVCWLFMAFILMQSFTANLSAILTVDQLKFSFSEDYYVGYHEGSFMKKFLIDDLHIMEPRLKPYASIEQFHEAMSKGSKHGGIDAIFDEIPYMKLFLNRYESKYKMVGPTYKTDGLGFAFPPNSPLVAYFSRAIVNVTQGPIMNHLEQKNFGPGYSSQDPQLSTISQGTSSLTLIEFAGLFLAVGSLTLLSIIFSETSIGFIMTQKARHYIQNGIDFVTRHFHPSTSGVRVHEDASPIGRNVNCKPSVEDNSPPTGEDKGEQVSTNNTHCDSV